MQARENQSCQILKEACMAHRDGRPVVRRTFLAGLQACLFTKVDVLHWEEERGEYQERRRKVYHQFIWKAWKWPCTVSYQRVWYSARCGQKHAANSFTATGEFLKGFSHWGLKVFYASTTHWAKCSHSYKFISIPMFLLSTEHERKKVVLLSLCNMDAHTTKNISASL